MKNELTPRQEKTLDLFAKDAFITTEQARGTEIIDYDLDIPIDFIPKGFRPAVKGSMTSNARLLPEGFAPYVTGYLYMPNLKAIPRNFKPCAQDGIFLPSVKTLPDNFDIDAGHELSLDAITVLPKGFAPKVANLLCLPLIKSIPEDAVLPDCHIHAAKLPDGTYVCASGNYLCVEGVVFKIKTIIKKKVYLLSEASQTCYGVAQGQKIFAVAQTLSEAFARLKEKIQSQDRAA